MMFLRCDVMNLNRILRIKAAKTYRWVGGVEKIIQQQKYAHNGYVLILVANLYLADKFSSQVSRAVTRSNLFLINQVIDIKYGHINVERNRKYRVTMRDISRGPSAQCPHSIGYEPHLFVSEQCAHLRQQQ